MNIKWRALRWKIWKNWVWLRLDDPPSVKTEQPTVLPPRLWGARRVTIALEPPIQGRNSVVLQTRFHCGPALMFVKPLYQEVRKAINNPLDWVRLENELRVLNAQRGCTDSLFVLFAATDDVFLAGRMAQDRLFMQRVIEPPLQKIARMQMGQGASADTLIVVLDLEDFVRIFNAQGSVSPGAAISV